MKSTKTITLLLLSLFFLNACNSSEKSETATETIAIDKNAITWNPNVAEALAAAKKSGKLLFVECYSPTCPTCQAIEPYFSTPEVATLYNTEFINYKLDVGVAEQVKFIGDRNIWLPSFPQFLFFDGDGNLVHQAEVTASTETILKAAKDALVPEMRSSNFKARFEGGERDTDFLLKYGVYTRLIQDSSATKKVANALFDNFPKSDLGSVNSYSIMKKTVSSVDNGFFKYWINNVSKAAEYEKSVGHDGQEQGAFGTIIQTSILNEGKTFSTEKVKLMKSYMGKIGASEYADTYLWEHEALANLREGNKEAALKIGTNMAKKFADNGPSLVYITKVFNDNYPDNAYIADATKWINSASTLIKEENQLAEYYYELARLSVKAGEKAVASKSAKEALKHAKTAAVDLKKFETLISSIQ